jgi:hypothetical protein
MSVLVSVIGGLILLYSITASITDSSEAGLTALAASDTGLPPAQIFLDALGSPTVAKFLLFIVCVAQFFWAWPRSPRTRGCPSPSLVIMRCPAGGSGRR